MRLLLTILCFITIQANGQALFHAHNRVSTVTPCTGVSDPDACAYIERVYRKGHTLTATQKTALNTYITGLKSAGRYTGIKELYLQFMGGDRASDAPVAPHLLAFKDSAQDLTQVGGVVNYDETGAAIVSSGYLDTHIPTNTLPQNGHYLAVYSQTNSGGGYDIASYNISNNNLAFAISIDFADLRFVSYDLGSFTNIAHPTDKRGFYVATRNNAATSEVYRNGVLYNSKATASATPLETSNIVIGKPSWVQAGGRTLSVVIVGAEGLDATQVSTLYTLTNNLLTAFGIPTY